MESLTLQIIVKKSILVAGNQNVALNETEIPAPVQHPHAHPWIYYTAKITELEHLSRECLEQDV